MKKLRWLYVLLIGIALVIGASAVTGFLLRDRIDIFITNHRQSKEQQHLPTPQPADSFPQPSSPDTDSTKEPDVTPSPSPEPEPQPLPAEINLNVPFTSQAPYSNWSLPYQEACEEASILMVHSFYEGKTLSKDQANKQILAIVDFENAHYGTYKDTTAEETARLIREMWGYTSVRVLPATVDAIKTELAAGLPVLVPAAGRQLGNPNFTSPGPIYHMLVVKGYTKDAKFITNDPGTRNGANYVYKESVLMNAIHDWNGGDVAHGAKLLIVIDQ